MAKRPSKSKEVAQKTVYAAMKILKENGGEMTGSEVIDKVRETVEFSDWEKERYEKTGYILGASVTRRQQRIFHDQTHSIGRVR